jgi:hypothetical protein
MKLMIDVGSHPSNYSSTVLVHQGSATLQVPIVQ